MGLYEQLLEERAEEERRRGGPLLGMRGLDSKVLARRIENLKDRPGYITDLLMMHRLMARGVHSLGAGMRLQKLKRMHPKAYSELKAGAQGQ